MNFHMAIGFQTESVTVDASGIQTSRAGHGPVSSESPILSTGVLLQPFLGGKRNACKH